jgi:flagellar motor switch protein FliN
VSNEEELMEQAMREEREQLAASKERLLGMEHERRKQESMRDLDFILDIPLEVSVELGRTKMLINDLLQLGQGSVIELNKLAGEPLEILVNRKLVARGEVVVVNEKFGVRLTDVISPMERIKQLA